MVTVLLFSSSKGSSGNGISEVVELGRSVHHTHYLPFPRYLILIYLFLLLLLLLLILPPYPLPTADP